MKISVLNQHQAFFQQNGFIEFEEVLSIEAIDILTQEIDNLLAKRLEIPTFKLIKKTSYDLYRNGRDLFRDSALIKSYSLKRNFAEIAKTLSCTNSLRLAYDQAIYSNKVSDNPLMEMASLEEISSFQGILLGLIIRLSDQEDNEGLAFLPSKKGNVTFFKANTPIPLKYIFDQKEKFFMIVYSKVKSIYKLNEDDPNKNYLKKFGYVFGDLLRDKYHPILI